MSIPSIQQIPTAGKRVLVRVDFNVPLAPDGSISDDSRIRASLPTISYLLAQGASVILMSHLGRPKGPSDLKYSLKNCAERLSVFLKRPVFFGSHKTMKPGEVLLLENLRFHPEEENGDITFAKQLSQFGDVYINDAFGTSHRAHASTVTIAQFFPGRKAAGLLLQKEIKFLGDALIRPERPFYAIIGGSKVSSKLAILKALVTKADALFIGGAMAYTFLKAQGFSVGGSLVEKNLEKEALSLLSSGKIFLPIDHVTMDGKEVVGSIPQDARGADIGPKTIQEWTERLKGAKTIFWNGPLGIFEDPRFEMGTHKIALAITSGNAMTIVGGGDSISAIEQQGLSSKITHLSTGGGAALEFIEKGSLPGIDALE
ncbi:MAG: phosphoglycerate kinase [Chlamydiae bacterium]|nr:phosphoglycerate kinase [Chlamydiota bacterium]